MKKTKKATRLQRQQEKALKGSAFYGRMHRALARFVLWLFRVRVHDAEREPMDRPYLLCANHLSALDPILLAAALRRQQPHFMSKKELFRVPLLAGILRAFGAYPVDRAGDVGAIKTSISLLENGHCVGMFPQGTRCPGLPPAQSADKVKNGAGLLCDKTRVWVLPACLKAKKDRLRPFGGVDIIFGHPMPYETLVASLPQEEPMHQNHQVTYAHISHAIFEEICRLYERDGENDENEQD